jgi:hypothetical protein
VSNKHVELDIIVDSLVIKAKIVRHSLIRDNAPSFFEKYKGENMKRLSLGSIIVAATLFLAACASAPSNPAVGMWDVSMDTPVGVMNATINITPDLMGTMSSTDLGETALEGVSAVDNMLNFSATIDAQGQTLTLVFSGQIEGDSIAGKFDSDFGAIPVTGSRQ